MSDPSTTSSAPIVPSVAASSARRIAGASGIMMAAMLASRLLGMVRNGVIAARLGQGFNSDVYNGAFQLPDLFFYLIAGGALSTAFIPVFTELMSTDREREAWQLFSTVFCVMAVVIGVFILLGEIWTVPLVKLIIGFDKNPAKVIATVPLTRMILPAQICFFMGGIMMGCQQAKGKYFIPAMGPVIYNIGIILGGLLLAPWLGVQGFGWGVVIGAIVGNFALQWWAVRRLGMVFQVRFDWRNPYAVKVWRLMLPVILGVALPQVSIWVNRAFAARLGDGPMSAVTNANLLMQVPLGVFAQAMAIAIFPTLSALAANGKLDDMRTTASRGLRSIFFLTVPCSLFMMVLAEPIIRFQYQGGAFTAKNTAEVVAPFMWYCVGIFAWSAQSILSRSYYAMQDTRTPVIIGSLVTVVFIPMNYLFMTTLKMGITGLAISTTIAAALHMTVMQIVLTKRLNGFENRRVFVSFIRILTASILSCAGAWAGMHAADFVISSSHVKIHGLIGTLFGLGLGAACYLVLGKLLRLEELTETLALFRRKKSVT